MRDRRDAIALFAVTALVCAVADLATKTWIQSVGDPIVLIPNWLTFTYCENPHGMWSFGRTIGLGESTNTLLSVFSSVAVLGIVAFALVTLKAKEFGLALVLGAILGGAIGNLYDRLVFNAVRDFVDVQLTATYHYPTFNLADSFLVCGAAYLVLASLFVKRPETDEANLPGAHGSPAAPGR